MQVSALLRMAAVFSFPSVFSELMTAAYKTFLNKEDCVTTATLGASFLVACVRTGVALLAMIFFVDVTLLAMIFFVDVTFAFMPSLRLPSMYEAFN